LNILAIITCTHSTTAASKTKQKHTRHKHASQTQKQAHNTKLTNTTKTSTSTSTSNTWSCLFGKPEVKKKQPEQAKKMQPQQVAKPEAQRARLLKWKPKKTFQFPKDPAEMVQVIGNRAQAGALPPSNPTQVESSVPAQHKEEHLHKVSSPLRKVKLKANGESSSKVSRRSRRREVGPGTPGSTTVAVAVASSNISSFSTTMTHTSTRIPMLIVESVRNLRAPNM
jgi:hypothetical protein